MGFRLGQTAGLGVCRGQEKMGAPSRAVFEKCFFPSCDGSRSFAITELQFSECHQRSFVRRIDCQSMLEVLARHVDVVQSEFRRPKEVTDVRIARRHAESLGKMSASNFELTFTQGLQTFVDFPLEFR